MTPSERFSPDDPREWLNRAKSSLALARNRVPEAYLEDLCFLAQQAAEKAVKALLIDRRIEFPYVHDLGRLLFLLDEEGENVPDSIRAAAELTLYASVTRYPGVVRPVTVKEYSEATEVAEMVVRWVEQRLSTR
ncbi:MAG: HEPN domain-containing protein [Rhodospirillales bacterium]|nr:HEPN domain-containing protein [Rhodospirillales bacterium]